MPNDRREFPAISLDFLICVSVPGMRIVFFFVSDFAPGMPCGRSDALVQRMKNTGHGVPAASSRWHAERVVWKGNVARVVTITRIITGRGAGAARLRPPGVNSCNSWDAESCFMEGQAKPELADYGKPRR